MAVNTNNVKVSAVLADGATIDIPLSGATDAHHASHVLQPPHDANDVPLLAPRIVDLGAGSANPPNYSCTYLTGPERVRLKCGNPPGVGSRTIEVCIRRAHSIEGWQ